MNRRVRFRRRGSRLGIALFLVAAFYLLLAIGVSDDLGQVLRLTSAGFLLALAALIPVLALIAQFVLPVRERSGRRAVIGRLFNYVLGDRGTVTFVRNGKPQAGEQERALRGPGVLWVDHLSAALLRTDSALTRVVGPGGLAFTEAGERLAEGFDLRRQRRRLPGSPPPAGTVASPSEVSAMALTLEGIPVSVSLSVTFMLGRRTPVRRGVVADPPPIHPLIGALRDAAYGKIVSDGDDLTWSDVPLRLVVELWRDEVKERNLDEFLADHAGVLRQIEGSILARLSDAPSEPVSESEARLLKERGVQVLEVGLSDLQIPSDIQAEQLQAWFDGWAGPIRRRLTEAGEQVQEAATRGEAEASALLLKRLTHKLGQQLQLDRSIGQRESMILVLEDMIDLCGEIPRLSSVSGQLRDMLNQVKARETDCSDEAGSL